MSAGLPPLLWPLVQRLAGAGDWPPSRPEHAECLVWQAEREGLLPLLFDDDSLPDVVRLALEAHRALQRLYLQRSEILERAGRELARMLEGEAVILLKGAAYRRCLYARPEHRPMQDVDLLVPRARLDSLVDRLLAAGLEPLVPPGVAWRPPTHHERVLRLGEVIVEIHHSFVQRVRHRIDYEAIWERRQALQAAPWRAARLEDADALCAHALSLAVDEFSVPLIRYVDLWLMLQSGSAGALSEAAERARSWRAVRPLYGALRQLYRLLPESRSEAWAAQARELLPAPTRAFLDGWVLPAVERHGKGKNMSRPVELWRKLWLLDNSWRRLCFGAYHIWALLAGRWLGRRQQRSST